ncbi:MAG: TadE/TadG family type IV pilus assembly protein [Bdellovibrionales bacterium]
MNRITKHISAVLRRWRFAAHEKGAVAVEFALTLPIWVTILLGSTDAAYMMVLSQRVDRIAYSVTDIVTQSETVTIADLDNILIAASQLMQPFTFGADGIVIITSVYKPAGQPMKITWQHTGGGSLARGSKIGSTGDIPNMPNGLTLSDNENVIISEVYYYHRPLFVNAGIFAEKDVYRVAIYKPRLSPLITPPT